MKICVFDIETGALPESKIEAIAPPFNESKVKVGNLGLEKTLEKVADARKNHLVNIKSKAALRGEYGRLLACGFLIGDTASKSPEPEEILCFIGKETDEAEADLLTEIWAILDEGRKGGGFLVGHNSNAFDLPFLLRRSLVHGVAIPRDLLPVPRYFPHFCLDLMEIWRCGDFDPSSRIGLDRLAKAMGFKGKSGSGAHFQETLRNDPDAAEEYLKTDIRITWNVARRVVPLIKFVN